MLQIGGFRPWRLALGVVLGLAFASASQAQDFARKGGYAVVGGNYMLEQFTNPGRFSFGDSWGLNLRLGYRYLPWLSS